MCARSSGCLFTKHHPAVNRQAAVVCSLCCRLEQVLEDQKRYISDYWLLREMVIVFFHCLSLAIFGNFSQNRNLRLTISSSIFNKWNEWLPDIIIGHDEAFLETLHIYYQCMVLKHGWATVKEIKASSQILKGTNI